MFNWFPEAVAKRYEVNDNPEDIAMGSKLGNTQNDLPKKARAEAFDLLYQQLVDAIDLA